MKIALTFVLFLGTLSVFGQQENFEATEQQWIRENHIQTKTQYDHSYVNGKPASKGYTSSVTTYDKNGNIVEEKNYRRSGEVLYINTYKYDSQGNRIEYVKYDGNREKINYKQSFVFDGKGNKLIETGYNGADHYKNTYKYDGQGNLIEINYYVDDELDEQRQLRRDGNLTEIKVYDGQGAFKFTLLNRYDNRKNLIEEVKNEVNNTTSRKVNYDYDQHANLNEEVKYLYGNFTYRMIYKYDQKNNLLEVKEEKPGSDPYILKKYTYTPGGMLTKEEWRPDADKKFSVKEYTRNSNGTVQNIDCFFASYDFRVLYKFKYEYF